MGICFEKQVYFMPSSDLKNKSSNVFHILKCCKIIPSIEQVKPTLSATNFIVMKYSIVIIDFRYSFLDSRYIGVLV